MKLIRCNIKKINSFKLGAMFGLDARISLAIFGALSVISGASLYSAVKTAKIEQIRQDFRELIKASEQYYLDHGSRLRIEDNDEVLKLLENVDDSIHWKGPYIDAINDPAGFITPGIAGLNKTTIWVIASKGTTWPAPGSNACDSNSTNCYQWYSLGSLDEDLVPYLESVYNSLDEQEDGGDGALSGKVRFRSADSYAIILYRGLPTVM